MNKREIIKAITDQVWELQRRYGFDESRGYEQVDDSDIETIIEYGAWAVLVELLDEIEMASQADRVPAYR